MSTAATLPGIAAGPLRMPWEPAAQMVMQQVYECVELCSLLPGRREGCGLCRGWLYHCSAMQSWVCAPVQITLSDIIISQTINNLCCSTVLTKATIVACVSYQAAQQVHAPLADACSWL